MTYDTTERIYVTSLVHTAAPLALAHSPSHPSPHPGTVAVTARFGRQGSSKQVAVCRVRSIKRHALAGQHRVVQAQDFVAVTQPHSTAATIGANTFWRVPCGPPR
jgi:hypothetical protein